MPVTFRVLQFTIPNNSSESNILEILDSDSNRDQMAISQVICPDVMTVNTANFQFSDNKVRFDELYDELGSKLTFKTTQATRVALNPAQYSTVSRYLRLKLAANNASGAPIIFRAYIRVV